MEEINALAKGTIYGVVSLNLMWLTRAFCIMHVPVQSPPPCPDYDLLCNLNLYYIHQSYFLNEPNLTSDKTKLNWN